jgi:hypothetical protein
MTLILTLGNTSGVYQSSDYQLTDGETGAPVSDRVGSKQLQASFRGFDLQLAFTGIAEVGPTSARQRTVDWLSEELRALSHDSQLQDICDALARRCVAMAKPLGSRYILELILTVAAVGEPFRVAVISNVDWRKRPPTAKPEFTIRVHTITKPYHLISGYRESVPAHQRHRLRALARDVGRAPEHILNVLARVNAIAAKHSRGCVSEDCWVTSKIADGRVRRSASLNVGQHKGGVPLISEGLDLHEWIKRNFRAAPGEEITIVQSAGAIFGPGDGIPLSPPAGEHRRFTLSGSTVAGSCSSLAGSQPASIKISQLNCVLEMRCNEEATVPFATVVLSAVAPIGSAFPKPLYPWPQLAPSLMIDGAEVPRGWEYSVGYWIENETHHLIIPQSCRSIRGLAFLGPEDELIIVAPSTTMEFAWSGSEQAPSTTAYARVSWRSRLDGTRG